MFSTLRSTRLARVVAVVAVTLVGVVTLASSSVPASGVAISESGGSEIVVRAAGRAGHELMELQIDGQSMAVFEMGDSPSIWSSPRYQEYRYVHPSPVDSGRIRVAFVNNQYIDGVDLNLRVDWVSVDGRRLEVEDWTAHSVGTWGNGSACGSGAFGNEIIACNGYIQLQSTETEPIPDPPPTTTTTTTTTSSTSTTTTQPVPEPPDSATGRFYVVGSDIIGPDGNVFYPIGANVAIKFTEYGYVFEGGTEGVNDHLDDVRAWNWNTIRATLICDNDSGIPTFDELVAGITPTIERFSEAGIVVILECHDSTGRNVRLGSAKDLRIRRFWDEMVERFGDDPYVWFNLYNEPYASADGGSWAQLHQFYVDRIRATGAENIIIADLPVWAQGLDLLGSQSFADGLSRQCNTVFGWHAYGALANRQGGLAEHERAIQRAQAKGMAIVATELGVAWPESWGTAGPWTWNLSGFEAATTLGPQYGIGLLWWHATGDDAYFSLYALKQDRSGFWTAGNGGNLTPYGQRFWNVSHRVSHSGGPFTGDLAASGCASAQRGH